MTDLFLTVLDLSITASWVIAGILVLRLALRRAPKRYSYLLWTAAGFRLCCPVSFESMFSFFNLIPPEPVQTLQAAPTPVPQTVTTVPQVIPTATVTYTPAPVPVAETIDPTALFALIWVAGMAAMAAYGVFSWLRLRRSLADAVREEGNVWLSDQVRSPFILGYVNPRIYIPFSLKAEEREYVLAHERHHLRRGDHFVKLFAFGLLTLHWFNPLVWLAFFQMGRDMEMSCDEYVLGRHDNIASRYSMTLLSFASNRRFPAPSPLAFGESDVKPRIRNALSWKRPRAWLCGVLALVCLGLIVGCVSDPVTGQEQEEDPVLCFSGGQILAAADTVQSVPETMADCRCILVEGDRLSVFDGAVTHKDGVFTPVEEGTDPQVVYSGDHYTTELLSRSSMTRRLMSMRFYEDGALLPYSPAVVPGEEFQLRRYYDPEHPGETLLTLYIADGQPVWLENADGSLIMELLPSGENRGSLTSPIESLGTGTLYYLVGETVAEAEGSAHGDAEYRFVTLKDGELSVFDQQLYVVNGVLLSPDPDARCNVLYRGSSFVSEVLDEEELSRRLGGMTFLQKDLPPEGTYELRRYYAPEDPGETLVILYLLEGQPIWLGTPDGKRLIALEQPTGSTVISCVKQGDELICQLNTDAGPQEITIAVLDLGEGSYSFCAGSTPSPDSTLGIPFTTPDGQVNITNACSSTALVGIYQDPGCHTLVTEASLAPGETLSIADMEQEQELFLCFTTQHPDTTGRIILSGSSGQYTAAFHDLTALEGVDVQVPEQVGNTLIPVTTGSTMITVRNNGTGIIQAAIWWDSQRIRQAAEPITIAPGELGTFSGLIAGMECYLELVSPTAQQMVAVIDDGLNQENYTAP